MNEWHTISWESPSNIALIKYWGKKGNQIPQNPSLSLTLKKSTTQTSVHYKLKEKPEFPSIELYVEDVRNIEFENRIRSFIKTIIPYFGFLNQIDLKIVTQNNFPYSAGIASSASGISALALCLCSIEKKLIGNLQNKHDFFKKASCLSRLGSGSASRSVYGGYVSWGESAINMQSQDEYATPVSNIHPVFNGYKNCILIVDSSPKKLSSTKGHQLMERHPFAEVRYKQANKNYEILHNALVTGDEKEFIRMVENEALSLHALIMSSSGNHILLQPNSLHIIQKIKEFREQTELNICFTIDAGANIHILYSAIIEKEVQVFIKKELLPFCENDKWIDDEVGDGPNQNVNP